QRIYFAFALCVSQIANRSCAGTTTLRSTSLRHGALIISLPYALTTKHSTERSCFGGCKGTVRARVCVC
uniref:Uncharacterized protein n=1 Tax=Anopheles quadriannulatus TaxID=34691 RepID=A0A182XSU7_ANOQN